MKVRVQYTAQLRTALGCGEEEVELPEGSTLAGLVQNLAERNGSGARFHLTAVNGDVLTSMLMVVNDEAKTARDAEATVLSAGDVIVLLPPIAGG